MQPSNQEFGDGGYVTRPLAISLDELRDSDCSAEKIYQHPCFRSLLETEEDLAEYYLELIERLFATRESDLSDNFDPVEQVKVLQAYQILCSNYRNRGIVIETLRDRDPITQSSASRLRGKHEKILQSFMSNVESFLRKFKRRIRKLGFDPEADIFWSDHRIQQFSVSDLSGRVQESTRGYASYSGVLGDNVLLDRLFGDEAEDIGAVDTHSTYGSLGLIPTRGEKRSKVACVDDDHFDKFVENISDTDIPRTHRALPVRLPSGELVLTLFPRASFGVDIITSFFRDAGVNYAADANEEEIREANVAIVGAPESVGEGIKAKKADEDMDLKHVPDKYGKYIAFDEDGRALGVVSGFDTDYVGYFKKLTWIMSIHSQIRKHANTRRKNDRLERYLAVHGTRMHIDLNGDPEDGNAVTQKDISNVAAGRTQRNTAIIGESGVGKSEAISYIRKILQLAQDLERVLNEGDYQGTAEYLAAIETLKRLKLLATGDDLAAIKIEDGEMKMITEEQAKFDRTNFLAEGANEGAEVTRLPHVEPDGVREESQNQRALVHDVVLRQTHSVEQALTDFTLISNKIHIEPGVGVKQTSPGVYTVSADRMIEELDQYETLCNGTTTGDKPMRSPFAIGEFVAQHKEYRTFIIEKLRAMKGAKDFQFIIINTSETQDWMDGIEDDDDTKKAKFCVSAENWLSSPDTFSPEVALATRRLGGLLKDKTLAQTIHEGYDDDKLRSLLTISAPSHDI